MKNRKSMWASIWVGALGLCVPGCPWFSNVDHDEGRICASPMEGTTHCVASTSGPAAAWNEAKTAGTEPIQMWAVWPENVTLNDVVASPSLLNTWLEDVQTVLDYLRITRGNAEGYQASLSGKLGKTLEQAKAAQMGLVWEKSERPKRGLFGLLQREGKQDVDLIKVELVADKQALGDLQAIVEQAKLDGAPFAALYKTLVDDFNAYRATEAAETFTYTQWSHEVSAAALHEMDSVEHGIVNAAHDASAKPNALLVAGIKLSAEILQFETTSRDALAPHADFMSTHNALMPDLSSGALRSIHAMLGYTQQRVRRSDTTAKSLLLGAAMRRRALELLANTSAPARATVANALWSTAASQFNGTAQLRLSAVATKSMSLTLALPYLAPRYDEFAALLQMAPLCKATSSSWRETGCVAMRPKFKDATNYIHVTLPAEITQGLAAMKNRGIDPGVIEKVQQKLNQGDIKGAALAHDALLSSLEGT